MELYLHPTLVRVRGKKSFLDPSGSSVCYSHGNWQMPFETLGAVAPNNKDPSSNLVDHFGPIDRQTRRHPLTS